MTEHRIVELHIGQLTNATHGIMDIKDGQVNTLNDGQGRRELLEEFISRIVQIANEAGRTVDKLE